MARIVSIGLLIATLSTCRSTNSSVPEILWDTWGVPHIYAANDAGAFKAFGYAQMASHGNLILQLYAEARGRAAEYFGPTHLESDRYVRTMGIPARAALWYQQQDPAFRRNLDAFAEGLNLYARQHPDQINDSLEVVLPIAGVDVVGHTQRVVHFAFVHGNDRVLAAFRRPAGWQAGSNAWAIGPKRSATGNSLLLANPHLPWSGMLLFYEAHWNGPGYNISGVSLVGFPTPVIAFNDSLGWTHTVNTYDGSDSYRLVNEGNGYRWDGGVRPYEMSTEAIRIKQPDGSFTSDTLRIRRSVHGPVTADSGGIAIASRVAGLDRPGMLQQWWDMARARNLAEFESAVRRLEIPMFNVLYADVAGHIYYLFGGDVPKRSRGDHSYWRGTVLGDSSATLWTESLPYERLPRLIDPPTGWLQNANDPPWGTTVPAALHPDSFPEYLAPVGMHWRAQRSAQALFSDSSITFEELGRYQYSTRMELADRVLGELVAAARRSGSTRAARAAAVLEKWDRQATAGSRGAVLFLAWAEAYLQGRAVGGAPPFSTPWRLAAPITTPSGLASPRAAVAALESAAAQVLERHGALDVAWGDVMRLRYAGKDLPADGAPGDPLGVFHVSYYVPDTDGKLTISGGDSYYATVEFSRPVRGRVLLAYGNATQPGNPHVGDQLDLFASQRMREAWRTRETVEANLERREQVR
jgi:acyl-homoserine-lactone acylase